MAERDGFWAGIDLGGTGTRVSLVDAHGELAGVTVPTSGFAGHPVAGLADLVAELTPKYSTLLGVGIGASGPVDLRTGIVHNPDTLPSFTGLDVAGGLGKALRAPTWIDNDAVVAGLAESAWGLPSVDSLLCVTLGTGIGVALITNGRPVRAANGQHPEAGHIPVRGEGFPCYCGLPQCWEQVASRTSLDKLRASWGGDIDDLWSVYASRVADGLIALITLYGPAAVVIGGSVAQFWPRYETHLRRELARYREFDPATIMAPSTLGERGGALGASLLPRRRIGWSTTNPALAASTPRH